MEKGNYPKFVCDDLHFDAREIDSRDKPFNLVACEREAGKSVLMAKKMYNAFTADFSPSIVIKRRAADITSTYIDDIGTIYEKFTGTRPDLQYSSSDAKTGMVDVAMDGKLFFRIISLSAPMSRLKSLVLRNIKFIFFDEFICNLRIGEKYLPDEAMRFKELYTTYNREAKRFIKAYFFGNPYSLFNPYFSWLGVPVNKVTPGSILTGDQWVFQAYQIKPELKQAILAKNPLYQFDESYKQYAFDGLAVQDKDVRIMETPPVGFKLRLLFKLHGQILAIFSGYSEDEGLHFWAKVATSRDEFSKRRDIVCYDFGDMANKCILSDGAKKTYSYLRQAIRRRMIAFEDVNAAWLIEEIYEIM